MERKPPSRTGKVIFLGNLGVGKTALFNRIRTGSYVEDSTAATLSHADRCNKVVQIGEKETLVLDIWDTGGTEAYRTVTTNYYRNSQAVIFVYDVTDERSVLDLTQWISDAQIYAPKAVCMLLGNKLDLNRKDAMSENAANSADQLAREYEIKLHYKVSAKDETRVMEALEALGHEISEVTAPSQAPVVGTAIRSRSKSRGAECQRGPSIVLYARTPIAKKRRYCFRS